MCDMVDVVEILLVYLLRAILCAMHFHICVVACLCAKCVHCLGAQKARYCETFV